MTAVFVDTSAWFALADEDDAPHQAATRLLREMTAQRAALVTTNCVVSETYMLLRARLGALAAHRFLDRVRMSPSIQRVHVPELWEESAEEVLVQYHDQDFSYVDATSFIAMRRLRLQEAFTYDHHFAVMGFVITG